MPDVPDTLSALVRIAVAEARRLDPAAYHPNYNLWHAPYPAGSFLCGAGAVIAGILIPASDEHTANSIIYPDSFPYCWDRTLHAIDASRAGAIDDALAYFLTAHEPGSSFDPEAFKTIDDTIIRRIGPPEHSDYTNWNEFQAHLPHMEKIAAELELLGF